MTPEEALNTTAIIRLTEGLPATPIPEARHLQDNKAPQLPEPQIQHKVLER